MKNLYKKIIFATLSILSIVGYSYFVFAAAPTGGYAPGQILDPDCAPGDTDCVVTLGGGSSGWSLTGNAGTDGGTTNFLGTTDAQDLVVKTNGNQIALFGQSGNTAIGSDGSGTIYSGLTSFPVASGFGSTAFGFSTTASGIGSFALPGNGDSAANEARGFLSFVQGEGSIAYGYREFVIGKNNSAYTPLGGTFAENNFDRQFTVGNGRGNNNRHNAYTLWKDGSFAYNDDNFQNDNAGTEQNMFYFNYGNHNGLGSTQSKRAIRMGSATNDEWDITSANVGDRSVAIGFNSTIASGENSLVLQEGCATGYRSTAIATGCNSGSKFGAWNDLATAIGYNASAQGYKSYAIGSRSTAYSDYEIAMGTKNTVYSPVGVSTIGSFSDLWDENDRLFIIGNGDNVNPTSDAFTILKNGKTSIGYDNFETTTLDSLLQVNGSILSADLSGACSSLASDADGKIICGGGGGGSGWGLTGNAGTDGGTTNFLGTTDAQDFVVEVNSNEVVRFGQNGNIGFGDSSQAIGSNSFAVNQGLANGQDSWAIGKNAVAETSSFAFSTGDHANALGNESWALGHAVDATGDYSKAFGYGVGASSYGETALGLYNTVYNPLETITFNPADRLLSIGNGTSTVGAEHNAYTLWKDGSFAYNDDDFQNGSGQDQNMFYFNYGNHDGLGSAQTKRAIRLGSAQNNDWDINSTNVGDNSIAIGFVNNGCIGTLTTTAAMASGQGSIAIGCSSIAAGRRSVAIGDGNQALGDNSTAFGGSQNIAEGAGSVAFGSGVTAKAGETAFGRSNTISNGSRLVTIGNGGGLGLESDAFTILDSGQTGIGIDNFETNTNGNIFQVGDGATSIIGYIDDVTGNWVAVSDERKKDNITDLTYGLDQVLQLRPTSFNYKRNGEHTIGFIAQQVLPIIPEAVYGSESESYGMSYATLTPVIVKAIQEMNLKITDIGNTETPNTWRDALIAWFGNVENGIGELYVKTFHADRGEFANEICLGQQGNQTCVTKDQLDQLLLNSGTVIAPTNNEIVTDDDSNPVIDPVIDESSDDNQETPVDNSTGESGSENTEVTE